MNQSFHRLKSNFIIILIEIMSEMIDSIGGVVIMVSDQAQAVKFYAEKMGFDIRLNVPFYGGKWIEVAPKDSECTLSIMEPNPHMMSPEENRISQKKHRNKHWSMVLYVKYSIHL